MDDAGLSLDEQRWGGRVRDAARLRSSNGDLDRAGPLPRGRAHVGVDRSARQVERIGLPGEIGHRNASPLGGGEGRAAAVPILDPYVARLAIDYASFRGLRVAWDAGNGAAGPAVEKLTAKLPGEHHLLYTEVDSRFPNHHPDPTDEKNLADLQRLVKEKGLDFGFAFDGDGDRIGAVDENGQVVRGDLLLLLFGLDLLERKGDGQKMVFDESLIVPDPKKSLEAGAIAPWRKGGKRTAQEIAQMADAFLAHVTANPGQRMEHIAKELGLPTTELTLPVRKLLAERKLRVEVLPDLVWVRNYLLIPAG